MVKQLFVVVYAFRFSRGFWELSSERKDDLIKGASEAIGSLRSELNHLKTYECPRHDTDILFWASAEDLPHVQLLKNGIITALGNMGRLTYSLVSIYEPSPYLHKGEPDVNEFDKPPLKYFVAYPMSKTPEWYLIPYDERKKIMADHIRMATTDPENVDIRSFTTYSYGLGDQEFVVMYEVDSLINWSHVTGRLREAEARKWIVKEEPIFIGSYLRSLDNLRFR